MAVIYLHELWVHNGDDLADYVTCSLRSLDTNRTADSEVRTYGQGRRRVVRGPARPLSGQVEVQLVDRPTLARLDQWAGHDVFIRTPRGHALFAVYHALEVVEHRWTDAVDVAFTFETLSRSVALSPGDG